ncbi:unnamed protein product [Colias eurytheme]|nr:unnamed protein product [Colias eurytheme]
MKVFAVLALFVAFVALVQAAPADEEYNVSGLAGEVTEAVEVFGSARQRICTAALCRAVCQSLGFPRGSCNAQLLCVCRR